MCKIWQTWGTHAKWSEVELGYNTKRDFVIGFSSYLLIIPSLFFVFSSQCAFVTFDHGIVEGVEIIWRGRIHHILGRCFLGHISTHLKWQKLVEIKIRMLPRLHLNPPQVAQIGHDWDQGTIWCEVSHHIHSSCHHSWLLGHMITQHRCLEL